MVPRCSSSPSDGLGIRIGISATLPDKWQGLALVKQGSNPEPPLHLKLPGELWDMIGTTDPLRLRDVSLCCVSLCCSRWLFPRLRGSWENVRPCISRLRSFFLSSLFVFVLRRRLARAHQFHSLGQDQSTMAKRAETTVAKCSLTICV